MPDESRSIEITRAMQVAIRWALAGFKLRAEDVIALTALADQFEPFDAATPTPHPDTGDDLRADLEARGLRPGPDGAYAQPVSQGDTGDAPTSAEPEGGDHA